MTKPLYEGGKRNAVESYRKIYILLCIALVFKNRILKTMTSFLGKFNILSSHHYGFIAWRGTCLSPEDFADTLLDAFDKEKFACGLFL